MEMDLAIIRWVLEQTNSQMMSTQWGDIDGDGYGDNITGTTPDAFPTDATQWSDIDGDGYGDNPAGRLYDLFPENPTQWIDEDGDGLGRQPIWN